MDQLIELIVQNGLGVASFGALLYFIFTYVKDINETMKSINTTMIQIQINLANMTDRVDKIEEKINRKEI